MNPIKVLAAATAMELSAAALIFAIAGAMGWRSGWLDVINNFAPAILAVAIIAAGLALLSIDAGLTRTVTLLLSLLAGLYGLALIGSDIVHLRLARPPTGVPFRILSANVWRENPTAKLAVDAILARDADAVLLQEMDGTLRGPLARLAQRYPYSSNCPNFGVRIFVKSPIIASGCQLAHVPGPNLDFAWVQVRAADGHVATLATTHFAWPFPPMAQAFHRRILASEIGKLASDDLILTGDFNTTPWSFGMREQDRLLRPLKRQTIAWFSWPARIDGLGLVWRVPVLPIDHIYTGPHWRLSRLQRVRIPGSDHFGTEAVLTRSH